MTIKTFKNIDELRLHEVAHLAEHQQQEYMDLWQIYDDTGDSWALDCMIRLKARSKPSETDDNFGQW